MASTFFTRRQGTMASSIDYGPFVYHISFWLLPPLGAFPRHPPTPFFFALLPDAPDEVYLIGFPRGPVEYKVFERRSRQELSREKGTWVVVSGSSEPQETPKGKGLAVTLVLRRAT
jgi:hypothetical protein